jgi:dTDP-4-amino-4,6-dideoxygalactose transaminase
MFQRGATESKPPPPAWTKIALPMNDPTPTVAIPMQDLAAHHREILPQLQAAAARVLASGRYDDGPELAAFEAEAAAALGIACAVGVSSGSDALLALLMACGIGPGAQVVTTPLSFVAPVEAIVRLGATPVFADVDPDTLNLDARAAAACVGPRTRAVLTVHLFGRAAHTAPLRAVCDAAGIPLIEDAAQAIGARGDGGRVVGALGLAAALSFFPSKNLGGFGDGGMVVTDDAALADRIRLLRVHGARPKYHHTAVGGNFRLDELQAALLRVKLPHLHTWTARRVRVAARYRAALAPLAPAALALPPDDAGCVWNQFVVRVPDGRRDPLRRHLAALGVATAVYYPEPLHLQPVLGALGHRAGDFPRAERACAEALALPIHPDLDGAAVDRVCGAIAAFLGRGPEGGGAAAPGSDLGVLAFHPSAPVRIAACRLQPNRRRR